MRPSVRFRRYAIAPLSLAGVALVWLLALACVPGAPTPAPTETWEATGGFVAEPAPQPADAPAIRVPTAVHVVAGPAPQVTATPAPTMVPTSSPAPTPPLTYLPPTPESPPAASIPTFSDRQTLQERAFGYLSDLAEGLGDRTSATEQELEAAEFLAKLLTDLGYSPYLQDFEVETRVGELVVAGANGEAKEEKLETLPLHGSASGRGSGPLEFVGLGRPEDLPSAGLAGRVALVERGEIFFRDKVSHAASAGAVAVIIFNNQPGRFSGALGEVSAIPAIALSQVDGAGLRDRLAGEEVRATVVVENRKEASRNLIAELPGAGQGVVVLGAHYDTVPDSVGANDNASGAGALLAVAEELAGQSLPFTLRFILFGSEETGLHGSEHYVAGLSGEELEQIRAMINLDSVGGGQGLRASGARWLTRHVAQTAAAEGIVLTSAQGGRGGSDHANFREAGVPVIFFVGEDISRINSPADTMEHLNPELPGDAAALVLDLLYALVSLPGYGS